MMVRRYIMGNLSGYEEKKLQIQEKIEGELSVLPQIFKSYTDSLKNTGKADSTIYSYLSTLTACIRGITKNYYISDDNFYTKILESDIKTYFDEQNTLGVQALQRHWSVMNSFFKFLIDNDYITSNPMQSVKRPIGSTTERKLKFLTRKELERFIATIKHNPTKFTAFRDEVLIKLALTTGIDLADIVNLNYNHIDFDNNKVHVYSKKGKRLLPLSPTIALLIKNWIKFRNEYFKDSDTPALFVSTLKNRLSVYTVGQIMEKYCDEANVPIITFKDLKSTMVYLLALEDVSMEAIMELLGTSDYLSIVQAYDAAIKEKNINIINAIDNLFNQPFLNSNNSLDTPLVKKNMSIEIKSPEYSSYTGGIEGFTIFANITNLIEEPLKLKLKVCSIYINGMLRTSDYIYSGYKFDEEILLPNTTQTLGRIWITDKLSTKKIKSGDYLILSLTEIDSKINHQIKYIYNENHTGGFWTEESWYELSET